MAPSGDAETSVTAGFDLTCGMRCLDAILAECCAVFFAALAAALGIGISCTM